jgi:osmotically-inducible protein OsmY
MGRDQVGAVHLGGLDRGAGLQRRGDTQRHGIDLRREVGRGVCRPAGGGREGHRRGDHIKPYGIHEKTDAEIAAAAVSTLGWHVWVPSGIQATVEKGWITLKGSANWEYERTAAHNRG